MTSAITNEIGLYVHVPYCRLVCPYCDFVKRGTKGEIPDAFVDSLLIEIEAYDGPRDAASVFFGGGTPSMLSGVQLERILEALSRRFRLLRPEITLETNPDDVSAQAVSTWRDGGVTRLSLGVQSFDDGALRYLGRIHDSAVARVACERVAEAFGDWGMDLIFGAGDRAGWDASLKACRQFDPPHVSTYGLTYEEGTPFWRRRAEAIDDDDSLALYRDAVAAFSGYDHYEVSNFAKAGFDSRHNRIYWRNEGYVGFGPGAYSFIDGERARNVSSISRYIDAPLEKEERLSLTIDEQKVETLIQHFRTRSGLDRSYYSGRFGAEVDADFGGTLQDLIRRGLLAEDGEGFRPTVAGYELNNEIGLALVS